MEAERRRATCRSSFRMSRAAITGAHRKRWARPPSIITPGHRLALPMRVARRANHVQRSREEYASHSRTHATQSIRLDERPRLHDVEGRFRRRSQRCHCWRHRCLRLQLASPCLQWVSLPLWMCPPTNGTGNAIARLQIGPAARPMMGCSLARKRPLRRRWSHCCASLARTRPRRQRWRGLLRVVPRVIGLHVCRDAIGQHQASIIAAATEAEPSSAATGTVCWPLFEEWCFNAGTCLSSSASAIRTRGPARSREDTSGHALLSRSTC